MCNKNFVASAFYIRFGYNEHFKYFYALQVGVEISSINRTNVTTTEATKKIIHFPFTIFSITSSVPYSAIFRGCRFFDKVSEEKNHFIAGESAGALWALLTGVQERRGRKFWLFCILNISKHSSRGYLSIFRWINFYTFESLGACVWDLKPVYQLQNCSGYGTVLMIFLSFCMNEGMLVKCFKILNYLKL